MAREEALRLGQVRLALLAILQGAPPERPLLLTALVEGDQDGQGDLALTEVVPDGLAELLLLGRVVERVVHELERDAEVAPVAVERVRLRPRAAGDQRAHARRSGEQRGGLALHDLQILRLGGGQVVRRWWPRRWRARRAPPATHPPP